eukprot:173592_1
MSTIELCLYISLFFIAHYHALTITFNNLENASQQGWYCSTRCISPANWQCPNYQSGYCTQIQGTYTSKSFDISDYSNLQVQYDIKKPYSSNNCFVYYKYNTQSSWTQIAAYYSGYSYVNQKKTLASKPFSATAVTIKFQTGGTNHYCSMHNFYLKGQTSSPTPSPTPTPTKSPTKKPTRHPTKKPTNKPTFQPTLQPTKRPTQNPTKHPTNNPTKHPSVYPTITPTHQPSIDPTINPTFQPTVNPTEPLFDIEELHGKLCDNLNDRIEMEYGTTFTDCIDKCQSTDACRMVNFFSHFKSVNDSRCYVFDKICNIKHDINFNNNSIVAYKTFNAECIDYPYDWTDNIGDACSHYKSYNWCNAGNIFKDQQQFDDLIDNVYGLGATETCCDCGGGIHIIDNVVMSYDDNWEDMEDDILCEWTDTVFTLQYQQSVFRNWDSLLLYNLCNSFDNIDCSYIIDTNFKSNNDSNSYSLFICDHNHSDIHANANTSIDEIEFIFEIIIDDVNEIYNTYINSLWFDLDPLYYGTNTNINYLDYTQCAANILDATYQNLTYHYGVHPCYILDTFNPTVQPTTNPTSNPTIHPTIYPSVYPTLHPTFLPTSDPTYNPTFLPTIDPTSNPTFLPTVHPTMNPTLDPTVEPTSNPTIYPTNDPTNQPSPHPTHIPTILPTIHPTTSPTLPPTMEPTINPTVYPTNYPTNHPSPHPTSIPTISPTVDPTAGPTTNPTIGPTTNPTVYPTNHPSPHPTNIPTVSPTIDPTTGPTTNPTSYPSVKPTLDPTTGGPSTNPTTDPTTNPTNDPTNHPSIHPTNMPTMKSTMYSTEHQSTAYRTSSQVFTTEQLVSTLWEVLKKQNNSSFVSFMQNDEFIVFLSILLSICICGIIVLCVTTYCCFKAISKSKADDQFKQRIEMQINAISFEKNNHNIELKPSAPPLDESENISRPEETSGYCLICCDNIANMFNYPCGHVTYCHDCVTMQLNNNAHKCPICRQNIECKQIYNAGFFTN